MPSDESYTAVDVEIIRERFDMKMIDVPQSEIDEVLNWCAEGMDKGSHYRGMSYEEGVDAAIRWLTEGGQRPDTDD